MGGEVITASEAGDVARVADEHRGDDRPDPEELGERSARCRDGLGDACLGDAHLGVEAAQVVEVLEGERVAGHFDWARRLHLGEHALGAGGVDLIGDPAGHEFGQQGMEPARGLIPSPTQLVVALRQQPQHPRIVSACDRREAGARSAATATECASLGSFLFDRSVPNTRTRAARVAGTSKTSSPVPTSCWANR